MILRDSFYEIVSREIVGAAMRYTIRLMSDHVIYKAHFPNRPVTPGVCIIQIARELLEEYCGEQLEIVHIKNVKFLAVLEPDKNRYVSFAFNRIDVQEDGTGIRIQVSVENDDKCYAKLSLTVSKSK